MERLKSVVPDALADLVRQAPLCPEKIVFAWRATVGPAIDRVTEISHSADGTLTVTVADAAWRREVKNSSRLIVDRLARLLGPGVITRLKVGSPDPPRPRRTAGNVPPIPRKRASRKGGTARST